MVQPNAVAVPSGDFLLVELLDAKPDDVVKNISPMQGESEEFTLLEGEVALRVIRSNGSDEGRYGRCFAVPIEWLTDFYEKVGDKTYRVA